MSSPWRRLALGVAVALAVIGAFAAYTVGAVRRMRQVQSEIVEQNRKAALQLIRIQGDLHALGLAMRDMVAPEEEYPLAAWGGQFRRIHEDLDDAIRTESRYAGGRRDAQQTAYLLASFDQFWRVAEEVQRLAETGREGEARALVRGTLQARLDTLSALTSRLLVENNEAEQRAALDVLAVYASMERNTYWFLALAWALVVAVSAALIRSNRALFEKVTELAEQRRELARQLISTQESTLRAISRDLHDEFGQVVTAVGAMLTRAGRGAPAEFQEQLQESRVALQEVLEKLRALSQSLHPVMLEEQGLLAAVEWHLGVFRKQTGIEVDYEGPAAAPELEPAAAVHVYRILQEALNNVARHAQAGRARVRLAVLEAELELTVMDDGKGMAEGVKAGVGMAGMRERAALLGGRLEVGPGATEGTAVRLFVPLRQGEKEALRG